jgi:hypothetical protein
MPYLNLGPGFFVHYREREPTPDDQPYVQTSEPEPVDQTQPSQPWRTGDLIKDLQTGKRMLILGAGGGWTGYVLENGNYGRFPGEGHDDLEARRLHNTGLAYVLKSEEQVQRDFQNGLFTPYFEIF